MATKKTTTSTKKTTTRATTKKTTTKKEEVKTFVLETGNALLIPFVRIKIESCGVKVIPVQSIGTFSFKFEGTDAQIKKAEKLCANFKFKFVEEKVDDK